MTGRRLCGVCFAVAGAFVFVGHTRAETATADETTTEKVKTGAEKAGDEVEKAAAKAKDETVRASHSAEEELSDTWITTKVKAAFLGDDLLKGSDISVDTNSRGDVTLTGTVANTAAHRRAIEIAQSVKGVRNVTDALKLKGPAR